MKNNNKIKVVLFDMGGVLIKIHPEKFYRISPLLEKIFEKNIEYIENVIGLGLESPISVIHKILKENNALHFEEDILKSFTIDYIGQNITEIEEIIVEIAKNKKFFLALLSNTNEIHFQYCLAQFPNFSCFQKLYLSYQIHLVKPDIKFFEYILNDLTTYQVKKVKPEEIFYIDDSLINIQTAQTLGINGLKVTSNAPEADLIQRELSL